MVRPSVRMVQMNGTAHRIGDVCPVTGPAATSSASQLNYDVIDGTIVLMTPMRRHVVSGTVCFLNKQTKIATIVCEGDLLGAQEQTHLRKPRT